MQDNYKIYECRACKKEVILLSHQVDSNTNIACPFCASKSLKLQKATASIKECMDHSSYRKVHGVMRQVK